ncbi:MAG: hypothetical protein F4X79_05895 [Acidobacteria bacterium]|nr:hypothetical protein [Acidobacteriota bacterium]
MRDLMEFTTSTTELLPTMQIEKTSILDRHIADSAYLDIPPESKSHLKAPLTGALKAIDLIPSLQLGLQGSGSNRKEIRHSAIHGHIQVANDAASAGPEGAGAASG